MVLKCDFFREIISYLEKKFEGKISSIDIIDRVDIEMLNHLSGKMNKFLKLNFRTINVQINKINS